MIKQAYKYSELTSKIIGCAIEVHKQLGNGFQEVIYQRVLAIEMCLAGIEFNRELHLNYVLLIPAHSHFIFTFEPTPLV